MSILKLGEDFTTEGFEALDKEIRDGVDRMQRGLDVVRDRRKPAVRVGCGD